jgi:hypothetical protein
LTRRVDKVLDDEGRQIGARALGGTVDELTFLGRGANG